MKDDTQLCAYNLGRSLARRDIDDGKCFASQAIDRVMLELEAAHLPQDVYHRHQFKFGYAFQYNTEKEA